MSFDQPSLFEEKLEELTGEQIIKAVENGVNPWTGEYDDEFYEEVREPFLYGWGEYTKSPIGTFEEAADWNHGDGHEMGRVVLHKETGKYFMITGTYSSWDSSDWGSVVEAEPYEFTETRYREKK